MRAETVSLGTELLLGQIVDTNAADLARVLAQCGLVQTHRQTVGDNLDRAVCVLETALGRADVVLTIGGLGPTEDDLTRQAIALALRDELVADPEIEAALRESFARRRLPWVDTQLRQALRPASGQAIPNPHGTAPGLVCRKDGKVVIAMPGPKPEFLPMLENHVRPLLAELGGGRVIRSQVLRVAGMGESIVEERLRDLIHGDAVTVAPYAKLGEVHLRVSTLSASVAEADALIAPVVAEIESRLGAHVYGRDDQSLESVILDRLRGLGQTLVVAESCTGGGLGSRITGVPGSSDVFLGGVVSYSNALKAALLGVKQETLDEHGAVSAECAAEMAAGARGRLNADWALSVTGIAGPGGGSEEKPVGLVYIGVASSEQVKAHRFLFPGLRDHVRARSAQAALVLLHEALAAR